MSKIVHNISDGTSSVVELTAEEQVQRDADEAAFLLEEQARAEAQAKIDKAIAFLTNRNYKAAYDAVQASATLSAEQKTLFGALIKGQAAVSTALNQIDILIDMDTLA